MVYAPLVVWCLNQLCISKEVSQAPTIVCRYSLVVVLVVLCWMLTMVQWTTIQTSIHILIQMAQQEPQVYKTQMKYLRVLLCWIVMLSSPSSPVLPCVTNIAVVLYLPCSINRMFYLQIWIWAALYVIATVWLKQNLCHWCWDSHTQQPVTKTTRMMLTTKQHT